MRIVLTFCLFTVFSIPVVAQEARQFSIPVEIISTPNVALDGEEEERQLADLQAQLDMAFWSKWMFFASVASILVSALALTGLLFSLGQTRRSITDNRTIGELQTQAYVQAVKCEFGSDGQILITCRNFGQSPATHFAVNGCAQRITDRSITEAIKTRRQGFKIWSGIGSDQEIRIKLLLDDPSAVSEWQSEFATRTDTLLISGSIIYTTVFNVDHQTDFAYFIGPKGARFRRPTSNIRAFWPIPEREISRWREKGSLGQADSDLDTPPTEVKEGRR